MAEQVRIVASAEGTYRGCPCSFWVERDCEGLALIATVRGPKSQRWQAVRLPNDWGWLGIALDGCWQWGQVEA